MLVTFLYLIRRDVFIWVPPDRTQNARITFPTCPFRLCVFIHVTSHRIYLSHLGTGHPVVFKV
jgi:hypothetical protein